MSQAAVAVAPSAGPVAAPCKLSDAEAYHLQQYAKIVRLRDAVFAGTHPTIKPHNLASSLPQPPPGPAGTVVPASQGTAAPAGRTTGAKNGDAASLDVPTMPPVPKSLVAGGREINPVLLENSDEPVKAELSLQRQRLERALRDEVEQRRTARISYADRFADVDVSDVLAKALTLVPQTAPPSPAGKDLTANHDVESDSFDERTFYSSQHDTPQSQLTSRVRNNSAAPQSSDAVPKQPEAAPQAADKAQRGLAQASVSEAAPSAAAARQGGTQLDGLSAHAAAVPPIANVVPGLNNYVTAATAATPSRQDKASGAQSQADDLAHPDSALAETDRSRAELPRHSFVPAQPPFPLVREHALQPVAPQTAQISSSAAPGQSQGGASQAVPRTVGTPAQVAALRQEPSAATSPESSSQGGRPSERKRGKKKKRKVDRQAPEVEANSYIKVEPRSPSPLTAPSYVRASKRQRQSRGQVIELEYEPAYQRPLAHGPDGQYLAQQYRAEQAPLSYDGGRAYTQRALSTTLMGDPRRGREYLDERRLPMDGQVRDYGLPGPMVTYPYSPRMVYPPRPVSHMFAGDGYREPARPLREYTEGGRLSVRPEGDVYVGHPNPPPPRLLVDAFGREYFDPSHPAVHRPAAPSVGPGEPGLVFERMTPRAVSRHPGAEPYGEGGVVYGGTPAAYAMPRRVVTQPAEYAPFDYRDGQHREYHARPMAPPGDYVEYGGGRPVNEAPRGYATRAASMVPMEAVRYEMPQAYGRMQSVRPDVPGHEFGAGVQGEDGREAVQPYMRDHATRPLEPYHRPQARATDEIAFIERPRGVTQEIVYADDARREVYR